MLSTLTLPETSPDILPNIIPVTEGQEDKKHTDNAEERIEIVIEDRSNGETKYNPHMESRAIAERYAELLIFVEAQGYARVYLYGRADPHTTSKKRLRRFMDKVGFAKIWKIEIEASDPPDDSHSDNKEVKKKKKRTGFSQ